MKAGSAVVVVLAVALAAGCGHKGGWEKTPRGEYPFGEPEVPQVESEYRLAVGDEIALVMPFQEGFNAEVVVRPDGMVTFPYVGEVKAAGYTPTELDSLVSIEFKEILVEPDLSIVVRKYTDQLVFVLGEVSKPGAYELVPGLKVTGALSQAGGPTNIAKLTDVVLIRRLTPYEVEGKKVDIERFFEDGDFKADAQLQSYDIVYVPRTKIGSMSVWLDTFFRGWTQPLALIVRGYDLVLIHQRLD